MTAALQLTNLSKVYKNGVIALHGIDLRVEEGEFFALLGPNGAGKSTTIGIISSIVVKTGGRVQIGPYDLDFETEKAKTLLGVMPQELNLNIFETCAQIVLNQASYYGVPRKLALDRAESLMHKLGLTDKRNQPVKLLSGGMKRRLMIVRALIHAPKILILDEPTAGVDVELRQSMWVFFKRLNEEGTTIILTTHYLEEAEMLCRKLAIINKGKIIREGRMTDLLRELEHETVIFELAAPITAVPKLHYPVELRTPTSLAVQVKSGQCLNALFQELLNENVKVLSMRNEQNRLERLFLNLTAENKA